MEKKILIAGIGNLLFTDEGIGVHIIKELSRIKLPEYVELAEIGTATFELTRFMEGKEKVIIVDAILSDDPPGTTYRLTPKELGSSRSRDIASLHQFGISEALECAAQLGYNPEMVIFGIAPKDYQSLSTELSPELKGSLRKIVETILQEINLDYQG
jgi:hydrogenase maturation protease